VYVTNFKCLFTPDAQQLAESSLDVELQKLTSMVGLLAVAYCRKSKASVKGGRGVTDQPIEVVCKDFRVLRLAFSSPTVRKEFMDEMLRCLPARLKHTFAFRYSYKVAPAQDGWQFYDPAEELERFGLPNHQWRISEANSNYELAPSYPRVLVIPSHIQDKELAAIATHRQHGRLPVLCWRHAGANITLCRSSRPRQPSSAESSSATLPRCFNDEKLLGAIAQASVHLLGATPYYIIDCGEKDSGVARTKAAYQQAMDMQVQFLGLEPMAAVREAHAHLHKAVTSTHDEADDSHWMTHILSAHWLDVVFNYLAKAVEVVELMRR
jgi:Myotubularin-like phosphatase domain